MPSGRALICPRCGSLFDPGRRSPKRWCSDSCRKRAWEEERAAVRHVARQALEPDPEVGKLWIWMNDTVVAATRVDPDDWQRFKHLRLHLRAGYAALTIERRAEYLHRLILGLGPNDGRVRQADHINRDKLDNRRDNLRVVSSKENNANRGGKFAKHAV